MTFGQASPTGQPLVQGSEDPTDVPMMMPVAKTKPSNKANKAKNCGVESSLSRIRTTYRAGIQGNGTGHEVRMGHRRTLNRVEQKCDTLSDFSLRVCNSPMSNCKLSMNPMSLGLNIPRGQTKAATLTCRYARLGLGSLVRSRG